MIPYKWPELNTHSESLNYALPANRAGAGESGGGVGTGLESASEFDLPGKPSGYAASQYSNATAAESTANLYAAGGDPYAVPPLPHMNPNTPYHDEPNSYGAQGGVYYDPYRGPVPQTFNDTASVDSHGHGAYPGGEAIPMSNLAPGGAIGAGRRSPGPQTAYGALRGPSPQPAMAGRQSPGPSVAYSGGYGGPGGGPALGGRRSPGPDAAYGGM